ncbi:hypothetical protein B0G80_4915 [Paraburkholderia sp. BL6669N2]|nr:hypothetical protein B0G80_4915 [Paraburkholderia sp. BL6669N2]
MQNFFKQICFRYGPSRYLSVLQEEQNHASQCHPMR